MRRPVPFGKYLLLDRISVGGMAEVFKAKSFGVQGFEKVIAIKRILPSLGQDEEFINMFVDEAKIAGQLAHTNIGQIHELGQIEGSHFIAMEYIWGRDLLQLQSRFKKHKKRMSVTSAAFIIMKIAEGLHYAHKKCDVLGNALDIVHRDCSPQNVVVSFEGEVKLIDFGIARASLRSSRTQAGVLKGKFGYMSPEQVRGLPLDRRSDIFSLGIILFESLTGKRLFKGESDFTTLEKVRNAEIDLQVLRDAEVPPALEKIVLKALHRTPDNRYQWCADMRDDLCNFLQTSTEVYTYRSLGEEMHDLFGDELAREQTLMDIYSTIGQDGISQELFEAAQVLVTSEESSVEGLARDNLATSSEPGLARGSQLRRAKNSDDLEDHPTVLFKETGPIALLAPSSERGGQPHASEYADSKEQATQFREFGTPPPLSAVVPLGSNTEKAPVLATPPIRSILDNHTQPVAALPAPGYAPSPPKARRRIREILIGVSLALAILLVFVVVKGLFFASGTALDSQRATLVVLVGDKRAADVYLGGERIGGVPAGGAFTVDSLKPGSYDLRVARDGAVPCQATLSVDAKRVEVFNCEFADEQQVTLFLDDLRADDIVIVDGKMVPAAGLKGGLSLVGGKAHSIAVTRHGKLIDEFDVSFDGQEEVHHRVSTVKPEARTAKTDHANAEELLGVTRDRKESSGSSARAGRDSKRGDSDRSQDSEKSLRATSDLLRLDKVQRGDNRSGASNHDTGSQKLEPGSDSPKRNRQAALDKYGYLTAWTRPWARIHVDGKDTGKVTPIAPAARIKLSPGTHKVRFMVGRKAHEFSVIIKAGQETKLVKILD